MTNEPGLGATFREINAQVFLFLTKTHTSQDLQTVLQVFMHIYIIILMHGTDYVTQVPRTKAA